jgi:hypothetical protein
MQATTSSEQFDLASVHDAIRGFDRTFRSGIGRFCAHRRERHQDAGRRGRCAGDSSTVRCDASGTAGAAGETLTGDQVLARAAATDGIAGYNVPIHFAVRLLRPIGAKGAVEGVATFTAPAQAALAITQAPPPIGTFFRGTYTVDMVPQAWAAKYHVSSVSTSVAGGAPVYVLQAQPVPAAATIDGVTFQIGQSDFAPLSAEWL